jgi:hypothetical protein
MLLAEVIMFNIIDNKQDAYSFLLIMNAFYPLIPYYLLYVVLSNLRDSLKTIENSPAVASDPEKYRKSTCMAAKFELRDKVH